MQSHLDGEDAVPTDVFLSSRGLHASSLNRNLLIANSIALFVLLIICFVMYHRVQQTLDRVDSITKLNPFSPGT